MATNTKTVKVLMQQRSDTTPNWTSANPVLMTGEVGYDTVKKRFKVGDGVSTFTELPYYSTEKDSSTLISSCTGNELLAITSPVNGSVRFVTKASTTNATIKPGMYLYIEGWKRIALEDTAVVSGDTVSGGGASTVFTD